ncbi:MAG TPA: hypothetical protein VIP77_22630 [Jiangellaceae bacterium]
MTAPDPLVVRIYDNQISRHEAGARSEFANVQGKVESLARDLETLDKSSTSIALGAAKNLARDVADLVSHLSALTTLHGVGFLARPDGRE